MRKPTIKTKFRAEFEAWRNAIDRCTRRTHSQYNDYGGRGIGVHQDFTCPITGFVAFLAEVGAKRDPKFTLERLSNEKGYEPGNIGWVSRSENQLNRRKPKAKARDFGWGIGHYKGVQRDGQNYKAASPLISFEGRTQTIRHWSDDTGLSTHTITQRLLKGWPLSKVLSPTLLNPQGRPRTNQTKH